nr:hypothetical protein [Nonlabens ulvanivorans]
MNYCNYSIIRLFIALLIGMITSCKAQDLPRILTDDQIKQANYLPDYSYAGYKNGEKTIPEDGIVYLATDYGGYC